MKIHVKELGAIKAGTIDLSKKLNVFCGPNGTGKTYMAFIAYALTRSDHYVGPSENTFVAELIDKKEVILPINFKQVFEYKKQIFSEVKGTFDSLFGLGEDEAKTMFLDVEITNTETNEDFETYLKEQSFNSIIKVGNIKLGIEKENNSFDFILRLIETSLSTSDIESLNFFLFSKYLNFLATYPISSSNIFPVERNSIYTFSKELSLSRNEAIDHLHAVSNNKKISRFDLFFKRTTRYPMPIRDGLVIAEDLANIKKVKSDFFEYAEQIENELLHGKVIITNDGEINFKSHKAPKKQLPIHLTASIIKTLSSLVVYLKHLAQKNDLIIIDEPEINLHPDNQVILTKLFARLINKGFRLLISTHSDYIVREINNLIMLSSSKEEINSLRKQFNYKQDEFISIDDVSVSYFNYPRKGKDKKQVIIEKLLVDESGFEIPSLDETIDMQNKVAEELFYNLKYSNKDE